MASLNSLTRTSQRAQMRVGRGGKRGKTSGRGTKGQNARAGRKKRPEIRDFIKKLPKRRGFGKNRARGVFTTRPRPVEVTLERLEKAFASGDTLSPQIMVDKKVVVWRGSALPRVKILATGALTKKFVVSGCDVSQGARMAIEKAGGSVA